MWHRYTYEGPVRFKGELKIEAGYIFETWARTDDKAVRNLRYQMMQFLQVGEFYLKDIEYDESMIRKHDEQN